MSNIDFVLYRRRYRNDIFSQLVVLLRNIIVKLLTLKSLPK